MKGKKTWTMSLAGMWYVPVSLESSWIFARQGLMVCLLFKS